VEGYARAIWWCEFAVSEVKSEPGDAISRMFFAIQVNGEYDQCGFL
jgi:hypothetical protein